MLGAEDYTCVWHQFYSGERESPYRGRKCHARSCPGTGRIHGTLWTLSRGHQRAANHRLARPLPEFLPYPCTCFGAQPMRLEGLAANQSLDDDTVSRNVCLALAGKENIKAVATRAVGIV